MTSRRDAVKYLSLSFVTLLFGRTLGAADSLKPSTKKDLDLPLVEPGKGMAETMKYQHSINDVTDSSVKIDRSGVPFAKQDCKKCALYTAVGKKGNDEVGKCTLFQGGLVKNTGWCISWNKKS